MKSVSRSTDAVFALVLAITWLTGPASAGTKPACALSIAEQAMAESIDDQGTLVLADHRKLRLANLHMTGDGAAKFIRGRYLGKTLSLAYDGRSTDRHGRLIAHVYGPGWLQAEMVSLGLARVTSTPTIRRCAMALLALEDKARRAHMGLWQNTGIRNSEDLAGDSGTFQIVEGIVFSAKLLRDRMRLNFGPDYKTDFTVTVSKRDLRLFTVDGIDPLQWQGQRIRVRGWLTMLNGPEMEITHPEQVEVLRTKGK